MIVAIVLVVIVIMIIGWLISISNGIERAKIKIDEAASGIDTALTKRYDVLTKMIEVVKGYAKHEKETMFKTIELRSGMSVLEMNDANKEMDKQFEKINVLAEAYPELKANQNFALLQEELSKTEDKIAFSRQFYNDTVQMYNTLVMTFPTNLFAKIFGFKEEKFFEIENKSEKENVKVKF